jgi:hypothetical protein
MERNVEDMVTRGAEDSGKEMQSIADYLTRSYSQTNVNSASAQALQSVLALSEAEPRAGVAKP